MWVLLCLYYLFYKLYVWELLMTLVAVSHISLLYSLGVSCSCNCLILWRKTDEVSCAPTLAVLFLRDITVFMGNSPVSITWPETSIQAQQCRCIPTGNRGIVWVVSVLLSYTESWYLLELVPVGLFWRVLLQGKEEQAGVWHRPAAHAVSPAAAALSVRHRKNQECFGGLLP